MIRQLTTILFLIPLSAMTLLGGVRININNPGRTDRLAEVIEIPLAEITDRLDLKDGETFVIKGKDSEVPYQITYDGKVIFPIKLKAKEKASFNIEKGTPSEVTVKVCGKHYPKRVDDIAWENDLSAYRVYGYKEDSASGYDIFAKRSTDLPVLPEMYRRPADPELKRIRNEKKKISKDSADRFNWDHISFHVDHGFGADCYGVGPTLGAGVAALLDGEQIVYPFCYDSFEILDNGPIRFTMKLTFRPFEAGGVRDIVETRVITLDLGSRLNRTDVTFANLDKTMPIVAGIVLQDKDEKGVGNKDKGYIAYPAPTMNFDKHKHVDNGTIYVGNYTPEKVTKTEFRYFSKEESKKRGNSKGHILLHSEYRPGETFTYYWGNGWNHWDMESYEEWIDYLERFSDQHKKPLKIRIK